MPRSFEKALVLILVISAVVLNGSQARALPRYTAQYGQNCVLCHANPTGGGLRTEYATQFLVPEEIAARGWNEGEGENMSPRISPNITMGVDLRTLLYQQEGGSGSSFAMQGDLYFNLELSPGFSAYIEQGISGSGEVFGIARADVLDSYLKAGRFIPDYGWRFADHQMFNRRYLSDDAGSESPAGLYGEGLELGISPGGFSATAALLGGSQRNGDNYAGKVLYQRSLGDLNMGLGGSVLRRQLGDGARRAAGGLWYLAYGPFTWLGEIDETKQYDRLGNMVTHELAFQVRKGYDLRLTYNFQDPDRASQSGSRQRYGVGISAMPTPFYGFSLAANYWDIEPGTAVTDEDRLQAELMIHFFY